ncbi:hypothetical protein O1611_g908 [Lasiodiplodia mahajangana]|uniref:Uncharacterized protein n=1 Tax=Lasiodiplodia mahajangana TaxID=1108764 RepID=A0ACC2JYV8_9PEZI|nr:hypothetical protein O1611_g908 [Lasiodiplodia mahajangana]
MASRKQGYDGIGIGVSSESALVGKAYGWVVRVEFVVMTFLYPLIVVVIVVGFGEIGGGSGGSTPTSTTSSTTLSTVTKTTTSATGTSTACSVSSVAVTFNEVVTTVYGQTIKIVGSIPELGNWDVSSAPALSAAQYTDSNHLWTYTLNLAPGRSFEYKFVNVAASGAVTWESDPNRSYTVASANCASTLSVATTWR